MRSDSGTGGFVHRLTYATRRQAGGLFPPCVMLAAAVQSTHYKPACGASTLQHLQVFVQQMGDEYILKEDESRILSTRATADIYIDNDDGQFARPHSSSRQQQS